MQLSVSIDFSRVIIPSVSYCVVMRPIVIIVLIICILATADAGCKRRKATNVLPEEWSMNATPAEEVLRSNEIPKSFSWLDIDGVNMVVSSWNQHIVRLGSWWLGGYGVDCRRLWV